MKTNNLPGNTTKERGFGDSSSPGCGDNVPREVFPASWNKKITEWFREIFFMLKYFLPSDRYEVQAQLPVVLADSLWPTLYVNDDICQLSGSAMSRQRILFPRYWKQLTVSAQAEIQKPCPRLEFYLGYVPTGAVLVLWALCCMLHEMCMTAIIPASGNGPGSQT